MVTAVHILLAGPPRYHIKIFRKTIHCRAVRSHDLWTRYELNRNQITSFGLMISNKLRLATRIDYKNIIRVGHDGVERIREGKGGFWEKGPPSCIQSQLAHLYWRTVKNQYGTTRMQNARWRRWGVVVSKTESSILAVSEKNMGGYKQPDSKSEKSVSAVIFETSFILMIAHRPFLNMVQLPRECTLKVKEILGQ